MRTLLRCLARSTRIAVFGYSEVSKGSILVSLKTVRLFVKAGAEGKLEADADLHTIRESLVRVAAVYKDPIQKAKYKSGEWSLLSELRRFDPCLWSLQWRLVESNRERFRRHAAEKAEAEGYGRLSWPFTNGKNASDDDFLALPMSTHRKVIRVFALLQAMVFARDKKAAGPFTWGISTCMLLQGNKPLMTLMNRLGYCTSYSTMNRERCDTATAERARPHVEKVLQHLLLKFAWDNLDARLVANTVRLVGKSLDWHGTILIAAQMPTAPPIVTAEPFRTIDVQKVP